MSITVNYDEPVNLTLAVDGANSKLPVESRNFAREGLASVSGTFTLDTSYPTGGYGPLNSFGLKKVGGVFIEDVNGYGFYYNKATDKVQVFSSSGTEVSAATNLSTLPAVYFRAEGRQY